MRFDHIQALLGWMPGYGATHNDSISGSSTHSAVDRWKKAGWVEVGRLDEGKPLWVWLTKKGLACLNLPYQYHHPANLGQHQRDHLYAITCVRLEMDGDKGAEWTSERTLLQGTHRRRGHERVHRPDAVFAQDDELIAIEVELSRKTPSLLSHILQSLLREHDYHGQVYHALKAEKGEKAAQEQSVRAWRQYTEIHYFAELPIRRYIRRVLTNLVQRGEISGEEAERIHVWWYPLAVTDEELAQEADEEDTSIEPDEDMHLFLDERREHDC